MIDDNPQGNGDAGAIVSEKDTMDALTDILDDPATDNGKNEVQADDEPEGDDTDNGEDAEGEDSEDSDDESPDGDDDGPELKGGRFAPHSAKVRLPDGRTTTVDELMQGNLRQSDYSRKTESLARERDEFKADRERFNQTFQELEGQRQFVAAALEQWKPQPPENRDDPVAWVEYQQREHSWNQWQAYLQTNLQQSQAKVQAAQADEMKKRIEKEQERLYQAIPAMSDPAKRQRIGAELMRFAGAEYGFSPEEIGNLVDHRMIRVLFDLHQAKARSAKAPEAVKRIAQKPKVVRGSNRSNDGKNGAKRSRIERLRETGSARDAEAALMDLDL